MYPAKGGGGGGNPWCNIKFSQNINSYEAVYIAHIIAFSIAAITSENTYKI